MTFPRLLRRCIGLVVRLSHACWLEGGEWGRAFLRAIPGEIGCFLRGKLYGFRAGKKTRVLSHVLIYHPGQLILGDRVGISSHCQLNAAGGITICNGVLIGPGTLIWSQNHRYQLAGIPIADQGYERAEVRIDEDVWIAAGCIILPGVHLARGTVVAAGAVVARSTEPYAIVAGIPARSIGCRRGSEAASAQDKRPLIVA